MSSQERSISPMYSISPMPSIEKVSRALQENSVSSSASSSNDINNKTSRANLQATDEIVDILKSFEEITRHFSGSKYPTINLIYPYVHMLKNKYAPVVEKNESVEDWLDLIYGSSLESSDENTSISSSDKDSIPLAGNRKQWQYAHRSIYSQGQSQSRKRIKYKRHDDTNTVKYLPSTNCEGILEKMCAAIYLSFDKLWGIPNEVELKASMLDLQILKLLPFVTNEERKNTELQLREELLVLEAQFNQNNDNLGTAITVEEEEYDFLSAELWGLFAIPNSQAVAEDELI
ncbi:8475_t:CDS:2 [Dentiscutata erythropus]|uniref:8475_t:CDS:1 n=1 Tax=Dentiscutata erythropus TaxID=1348616 RepID=A0A9N9J5D9_9GLOM|nr:8475_t:CDS:2 [Dentiscutata erythropus]